MSYTLTVDTGIPLPSPTRRATAYPFADMAVGDSVYIPGQYSSMRPGDPISVQKAVKYAYIYGRRHGRRFAARNEGDGVRIWRLPDPIPASAADLFD